MAPYSELNGESKITKESGPFFAGLFVPVQEILFCLCCPVGPVEKKYYHTVHYFNFLVPIAQQAEQAAVLGRLSIIYVSVLTERVMSCFVNG